VSLLGCYNARSQQLTEYSTSRNSFLRQWVFVMTTPSPHEVTELLLDWSNGNQAALEKLIALVDRELHRLAHHYMRRENPGHTLQTTALVNEAYLRLVDQRHMHWKNRAHFFALAGQLMRRILVDHARGRQYAKRAGGAQRISFDEAMVISKERGADLIALDEALERLAAIDLRKSKIVEARFFGGLSVEETAEALHISPVTVMREWSMAKAWLYNSLNNEGE
jgi:RNA polymerase sigma factor (TIGR02999 family)